MITVDYDDNDDDDDGDDNDNDGEDDDDDDNDDDDGMFGWHWRAGVNATEDCRRFSTNPFLASTRPSLQHYHPHHHLISRQHQWRHQCKKYIAVSLFNIRE